MRRTTLILLLLSFYTINSNAQWSKQDSGTNEKLTDVIMLDSKTAIVVGRNRSILRTSDAGKTWKNLTIMLSSTVPWNNVSFLDTLNGIAVGDDGIRTTSDGGKIWLWQSIPFQENYLSSLYLAPGNIYVGAESGSIYHSVDSGKTWTGEKIGDQPIRSLFYWQGVYIFGLPFFALTPLSLYVNQEFPKGQWSNTQLPLYGFGSEVFNGTYSRGGGPGFIVGTQGELLAEPLVLRKKISDTTWQALNLNIHTAGILYEVSAPSETVVYACGTNGMIINSYDGGDSWTLSEVPTSLNLNAISFYDESHGFAVGDSGVILYTSNGGLTNIDNSKKRLPTGFKLYQNYPNPFNPITKIKYIVAPPNLPKGEAFVSLKVYNILGNEIATLVNKEQTAGNYEVEFDASNYNLCSGIYFYVLKSGENILSKKMCLIK